MPDNVNDRDDRMQKMLSSLFDLQRFVKNPRVEQLIAEAGGYDGGIREEDLELVNAAGVSRSQEWDMSRLPFPLFPEEQEREDGGTVP